MRNAYILAAYRTPGCKAKKGKLKDVRPDDLAALGCRTAHVVRQATLGQLQARFRDLLPAPLLSSQEEGDNSRERVFSLRFTFECFVWQMLKRNTACREVVRHVQTLRTLLALPSISEKDSAYIQARHRLPKERLEAALHATAHTADRRAGQTRQLQGRPVKVVDGSSVQLADTDDNQQVYPQASTQKPGCGFPLLRLVGVFSLSTGALLDYAKGNKHQHELGLLQRLLHQFKPGDLVLADRGFSTYALMALLWLRSIQSLFRLHHARQQDFRKGKRLGKNDRLFTWPKPNQKPCWLPHSWCKPGWQMAAS